MAPSADATNTHPPITAIGAAAMNPKTHTTTTKHHQHTARVRGAKGANWHTNRHHSKHAPITMHPNSTISRSQTMMVSTAVAIDTTALGAALGAAAMKPIAPSITAIGAAAMNPETHTTTIKLPQHTARARGAKAPAGAPPAGTRPSPRTPTP